MLEMIIPRWNYRKRVQRVSTADAGLVDKRLYRSYTVVMKTAISLPDRLYYEAEKTAQSMGIPRSQLFAKALEEFIEHHKRENVTERLNRVYSKVDRDEFEDTSNAGLESLRNFTRNDSW